MTGILTAAGGDRRPQHVGRGIPAGRVPEGAAVLAVNAGRKSIILESGAQTVADRLWVAKKGSALRFITDLAGKRIALAVPSAPP